MTNPTDKPVLSFSVTASDETDPPTAYCSPENINVTDGNSLIEFNLTTPGYSFDPETPITFNESTSDFPDLWVITATQITMRDRCTTAGTYAFTVHVVEDSTGKRFKVDPSITNEPI